MIDWQPRVAIVGTGGIARVHLRMVRELGGKLVAVCGRTLAGAQILANVGAYDDPARMLRECAPDVVHVCSPHHLHAEHSIVALNAGAHVLCEKPMATSVADGLRMAEAADRAGRIGAIAYNYRGYPLIEVLRGKISAGAFGAIRRVCGLYLSQDVLAADKYVWMFSPGTSGRSYAVLDLGIHWLDLAEFVVGERIVEITAQFSTHQAERVWRGRSGEGVAPPGTPGVDGGVLVRHGLEEQADLLVRFANGAAGSMTVSGVSPGNPNNIVLSIDGSQHGADWQQQNPNVWLERTPSGNTIRQRSPDDLPADLAWMSMLPPGHAEGYVDAFRNVVLQCWSAMHGEPSRYPSFSDGLHGLRLMEAAVQSAAEHRAIRVETAQWI
jgi:predicted dehydrogenase